ncbi:bifunctional glutamate N-acetyltransferase/amino-acid acetyltransferase ArgJ [Acetobacteraceae bacterium]|nr:bifunctional glutamate N-acetyltransferase/amino-acid acetyltransferase ArgJ [Acetobacteraceae bacterium]
MTDQAPLKRPLPHFKPLEGVLFGTAQTNSRYKNRDDLLLVLFDKPASVGGVLTSNQCAGIPVIWCRQRLSSKNVSAQALLVNAGNANVLTGEQGQQAAIETARKISELFKISNEKIFLGSTGVIGEIFPTQHVLNGIEKAKKNLLPNAWEKAVSAIMTTDTFPKGAVRSAFIGNTKVTIQGFVKGSGMIAPNMATMLAYIFTDANLSSPLLQESMKEACEESFNAITVDSDTSTSDMALAFALNTAQNPTPKNIEDPLFQDFRQKIKEITKELALLVLRDGEGVTRLMKVNVMNAPSVKVAKKIAFSIANSPLVKTAIAGGDPNWGRIAMAIGKAGIPVEMQKVRISLCGIPVAENDTYLDYDEKNLAQKMQSEEIEILVSLQDGKECTEVWGCDLTKSYIEINASYRS